MSAEILSLSSGDTIVDVAPGIGGAITRYSTAGNRTPIEWLRPAAPRDIERKIPTGMSCFPLVPFSNRIRDGRFRFGGRSIELPANFPPEPHAIHGQGWQSAWFLHEASADRLTIAHEHSSGHWPFAYRAEQTFSLSQESLRVSISVTNESEDAMPVGIGLHPYFVRTPETWLTADVAGVWLSDERSMPTHLVDVPADRRLETGIDPNDVALDHNFVGWNGRVLVEWADLGARLALTSEGPFAFLVVYTPPGEEFFCAEPVSNVIDAFNLYAEGRSDTGVIVLEPGENLAGSVTFTPELAAT
jgi:aldose 1-epimerase